jgi:protein required for attachment to host cells
MTKVRIVVADEREVNFFEGSKADGPLKACGSLHNETAGLKDIELETDREGRRYGQMGHHHGVDGERSTERHELTLFAKAVAERIDRDRVNHEFAKLVIVAPPRMLGLLRQSLSSPSQAMLAGEVSKDVVHHGPEAIRSVVPREAFSQLQ